MTVPCVFLFLFDHINNISFFEQCLQTKIMNVFYAWLFMNLCEKFVFMNQNENVPFLIYQVM